MAKPSTGTPQQMRMQVQALVAATTQLQEKNLKLYVRSQFHACMLYFFFFILVFKLDGMLCCYVPLPFQITTPLFILLFKSFLYSYRV